MTKLLFLAIFIFVVLMHKNKVLTISTEQPGVKEAKSEIQDRSNEFSNKGHILFFHNAGTMSHLNVMKALAEGLLERGHKVTTAFYGKTKMVHDNYTEVFIKDRYGY